ncbi:transposase, IS116/IS110/IS902 domain protein [Leptospira santarosai str. CBC379]|uniref:Transposase, IS116/IS110/IS902 domain protein n=1 Tax=Leptospira santarosai str. MOR084 TaxID=1049984 RepID=A0A0E2BEN2_9LEPT|nr:transposase, IS116/IS110/IS902 domain protein [Leptospira santarosai str. MOR084]EKR89598.1 transposase, IS116/IS110/IS902 domain protein [Leptospira santarosai str. CBC379]
MRVETDNELNRLKEAEKKDTRDSEPYHKKVGILRCFRGMDYLTAMFLFSEVNDFKRFKTAGSFMSFLVSF